MNILCENCHARLKTSRDVYSGNILENLTKNMHGTLFGSVLGKISFENLSVQQALVIYTQIRWWFIERMRIPETLYEF